MNKIEELARSLAESTEFHGTVKQNENLSSHTTMHVGGAAKLFLEPSDSESLAFAVRKLIEENVGFFILGGGSNVIISDDGLDAVISTRKMNAVSKLGADARGCTRIIKVECGASWGSVISFCKKNNLCGFEGFTGLSGTVGGALFMNATCFGLSACDNLVSVEYFDTRDLQVHTYEKNEAEWGYKKSPFQSTDFHRFPQIDGGRCGELPAEWGGGATKCDAGERLLPSKIILSAIFCVHDGFDSQKSENCLASRKEKGHFRAPSSGSAFKNDAVHGIIAGKVIDECALKGFSVGGAQIAPWHGNFIINPEQKATARDIKTLSDEVKKIVREKTGIALENEILFVGL